MLKNLKAIVIVFILAVGMTAAQPYITVGTGYNFPAASEIIYRPDKPHSNTSIEYENKYGSFGQGLDFKAAFGTMITQNFGLEIGVNYRSGKKLEYQDYLDQSAFIPVTYTSHYWGISPTAILKVSEKSFSPYIKAGVILAIPKVTGEEGTTPPPYFPASWHKLEYSGRLAFGYTGAIGAEMTQGPLSYFGEINFAALSWKPAKLKSSYDNSSAEYTLKDDSASLGPNDAVVPTMFAFSAVGINLGVKYNF